MVKVAWTEWSVWFENFIVFQQFYVVLSIYNHKSKTKTIKKAKGTREKEKFYDFFWSGLFYKIKVFIFARQHSSNEDICCGYFC